MVVPVNVGDVLAEKYEVERVLGEGGMGVVVAARHLLLGERVAIKFLLPQARERADLVARFLREGQAAARIRSEHVTRVYDVGTLARGEPYLVMEYLEGIDLKALLRERGPLPVELACDYLLQACEALAEAHALGIVHRDLKPGNLFLSQRADGSPLIKVIDFGISKMALAAETIAPEMRDMTQTATMLGSPLYMAPEQMLSTKTVDARADVWSMGAILYQLLTGAMPFRGESVMEIYDRILEGPPRLHGLRADVPDRLEWVVQRCLQRHPAERFGNIAELAAELARFAPPHAQHLAERAARVLRVRLDAIVDADAEGARELAPPRRPLSAAPGPTSAPPPSGSSSGGRAAPAASAWSGAPTALVADGAATHRSWSGTRASTSLGRTGARTFGIAAGLAAALLVGAGFGWVALRPPAPGAELGAPLSPETPRHDEPTPVTLPEPAAGKLPELLDGGPAPEPDAPGASGALPPASEPTARPASEPTPAVRPPARSTQPPPRRPPPPQQDLFSDPR
ncbi:protein kinase domain-containing protein [Sorangium sp. So ce1078]|uniref:serine/threonine-protein kinase n=1 Tax=Sorangium sp. So ce1078 TaxID=3133329 RepID=UPI003F5EF89C